MLVNYKAHSNFSAGRSNFSVRSVVLHAYRVVL